PKSQQWNVARVGKVEPDPRTKRTRVTWSPQLGGAGHSVPADARVYVLKQAASVFGHNAPDWHLISDAGKAQMLGLPGPSDVTDDDRVEWPQFEIYAPSAPNSPRQWLPPRMLTVQPTVESVMAAALEAAKHAKEAVLAEAAAAATQAAVALGKVTAAANDASSELTRLIVTEGGKQVSAAITTLGRLQDAINAVTQQAHALVGTGFPPQGIEGALALYDTAIKAAAALFAPPAPPDPLALALLVAAAGGALNTAVGGNNLAAKSLSDALDHLPSDMSGTALKALDDLLKTFKNVAREAELEPPVLNLTSSRLAAKLAAVARLTKDAADAAVEAATRAPQPVGALAAARAVEVALDWARGHQDLLEGTLPLLTAPQRVAVVAVMAAELATAIFLAAPAVLPSQFPGNGTALHNTLVAAARVAIDTVVVITVDLALLTAFTLAIGPTMWPLLSSPLGGVVAFAAPFIALAQPGARRVADAVRAAVVLALHPATVPAPARYAPRTLSHIRVDLDTVYPRIVVDGWLLLSAPNREELYRILEVSQTSRTDFALTGAVTRVRLAGNGLAP
ncbi:MAG: hypothetical protein ACREBE_20255, partial [bacterium]